MDRRERLSLFVCLLLSLILTALAVLLLNGGLSGLASSPPASNAEEQSEDQQAEIEPTVVARLTPAEPADFKPLPVPHDEGVDETPEMPRLASGQRGEQRGLPAPEVEPEDAVAAKSQSQETPEQLEDASEVGVPVENMDEPQSQTSATENEEKAKSPPVERLDLEGQLPPLVYAGELQTLAMMYPRMEMAWILDREPAGPTKPAVLAEIVMDQDGQTHWRNFKTEKKSNWFVGATTWHVVKERVHVSKGESLRLGRETALFQRTLAEAGIGDVPASRIRWGHYRHISEAYELGRAVTAFKDAVSASQIKFAPDRQDYLQVVWTTDDHKEPTISALYFHSDGGVKVRLPIHR